MKGRTRTVARARWGWRELVHLFMMGEASAYCENELVNKKQNVFFECLLYPWIKT